MRSEPEPDQSVPGERGRVFPIETILYAVSLTLSALYLATGLLSSAFVLTGRRAVAIATDCLLLLVLAVQFAYLVALGISEQKAPLMPIRLAH